MEQPEKNKNGHIDQTIKLKPIGVVRNLSKDASWDVTLGELSWQERAAIMKEQSDSASEITIHSDFTDALDGIEDFSHLLILYWPHLLPEEKRSATRVHPIGNKDFPLVGVFATRSPVRPNTILTTVVRLLGRDKNVLKVTGLDALDGSPVLDIKPYYPENGDMGEVRVPEWMGQVHRRFDNDTGK
jgi:tRNA-Thr(GGU) m(6)t(6)A37 methyltransferase TsaA